MPSELGTSSAFDDGNLEAAWQASGGAVAEQLMSAFDRERRDTKSRCGRFIARADCSGSACRMRSIAGAHDPIATRLLCPIKSLVSRDKQVAPALFFRHGAANGHRQSARQPA